MSVLTELTHWRCNSPGEFTILINYDCSGFGGIIFVKHNCLVSISDTPIERKFYCTLFIDKTKKVDMLAQLKIQSVQECCAPDSGWLWDNLWIWEGWLETDPWKDYDWKWNLLGVYYLPELGDNTHPRGSGLRVFGMMISLSLMIWSSPLRFQRRLKRLKCEAEIED